MDPLSSKCAFGPDSQMTATRYIDRPFAKAERLTDRRLFRSGDLGFSGPMPLEDPILLYELSSFSFLQGARSFAGSQGAAFRSLVANQQFN